MRFISGANPPLHVIKGFVRRIWRELSIDKIGMVEKGVFLIRFKTMEDRITACGMSGIMFDKKPFIVKPWTPSMSYSKDIIAHLPIWVHFPGLDVRCWEEKSVIKIASLLGSVSKVDAAIGNKDHMLYARVLVDINISKGFHEEISYENEHSELVTQQVLYDWRPVKCNKCNQFRHEEFVVKQGSQNQNRSCLSLPQ